MDHDIGENMLQIACWNNRPEIVGYLLNQGASMNRPSSIVTRTYPLHVAARKGAVKVVRILIERGADLHVQDMFGDTALHIACRGKWTGRGNISKRLVQELLKPNNEATTSDGKGWLQTNRKGMTSFWRMIGAVNNRGRKAWEIQDCDAWIVDTLSFIAQQLPRKEEEEEEIKREEMVMLEPQQDTYSQLAPLAELAKRSKASNKKGKKKQRRRKMRQRK